MPKKITLVLADEQTLFCDGLAAICESTRQFQVIGRCADGRSALRMIRALAPDVALLDLGLSRLDTLTVVKRIRLAERSPRILVLSTRRDLRTVHDLVRSGANGFLLKSDPARCLLDGLRATLGGSLYISPQLQLREVLRGAPATPRPASYETLSGREHEVLNLLVQGLSGKDIAERLDINPKTVSTYRTNLMSKLAIYNLPGLVKFAVRKRLISLR